MQIDVVSIFPEFFDGPFGASLLGKAVRAGVVDLRVHDLRRWATDRHRTVDDLPYGGGAGMVMRPEPFFAAADELYGDVGARPRTVLLTPRGRVLNQALVRELAHEPSLLLLCGRYEGIDERVHEHLATDEVSIGDYVLAGGEVAACVVVEAVTRLVPGVMGNASSAVDESFAEGLLEYPHYTRPPVFRGWGVPEVLRSGDHGRIEAWRRAAAVERTRAVRPDLHLPRRDATAPGDRGGAAQPGAGSLPCDGVG